MSSNFFNITSELKGVLKGGTATVLGATAPEEAAFILARLGLESERRFFLVVVSDDQIAERFCRAYALVSGSRVDPSLEPPEKPSAAPVLALAEASFLPEQKISPYRTTRFVLDRSVLRRRMALLYLVLQPERPRVLVTTASGLTLKLPPPEFFKQSAIYVVEGIEQDRDELVEQLVLLGYRRTPTVEEPGEFTVRGFVLDFWSPAMALPVRAEFSGDLLVSLRQFNPQTQKRVRSIEDAYITPLFPLQLDDESRSRLQEKVQRLGRELELDERRLASVLDEINAGIVSDEVLNLFPLAHPRTATLLDYLPTAATVVFLDPHEVFSRTKDLWKAFEAEYKQFRRTAVALPPESYLALPEAWLSRVSRISRLSFAAAKQTSEDESIEAALTPQPTVLLEFEEHSSLKLREHTSRSHEARFAPVKRRIQELAERGIRTVIVAGGEAQKERIIELLNTLNLRAVAANIGESLQELLSRIADTETVAVITGSIERGFVFEPAALALLSESEFFGERIARRRVRVDLPEDVGEALDSFEELSPGDYVVHSDYGIGIYRGLERIEVSGRGYDCLRIEYLGGDVLLLPATRLARLHRYSGSEGAPRLDRMGGASWKRTKQRIRRALRTVAEDLVRLYAERKAARGYAFAPPDASFREFEARFPFVETPHQQRAIEETIADMTAPKIMDRLICGDVGFGKTEVAMRAAYLAVLDGKQVAVLVPTTVLAFQHWQTFKERFASEPVEIEMLSRLRSASEQREILRRLREGRIDIIIGTHRLLGKDVEFANLGLLIIDEEHRFGVRHKERIKQLRRQIDCLTLTATPIPRTLMHAYAGIKDFSLIETAPEGRRAIRTEIITFDRETIAAAIRRELARGGQVYFVHNRVKSIYAVAELLSRLVPEARIAVAHGQMSPKELEEVFLGFVTRETNVLVTTTIIESGIDIPRVNTMFIHRADMMGLAQLYQLRGRVGRSTEQAVCYLIVPSLHSLNKKARSRLGALIRFSELGSGYKIARHDLELRGGGALLGEKQSGFIDAVGFETYLELLEEAIAEVRGEPLASAPEPELRLPVEAFIPEDYVPATAERLRIYKRLNSATDIAAVDAIQEEMSDIYGPPPEPVQALASLMRLKVLLRKAFVERIESARGGVKLVLAANAPIDTQGLVAEIAAGKTALRLHPDGSIVLPADASNPDEVASRLQVLLKYCKTNADVKSNEEEQK